MELRRRRIFIRAITDEVEPGGKRGTYKNRILGILRGAGFNLSPAQFIQLNRHTDKKGRIRTAAGHWAEGYVRILLNKNPAGDWVLPVEARSLVNQIIKVNSTAHDDLADAATDGFIPELWAPPLNNPGFPDPQSATPHQPGDDDLKWFAKKLTNDEIIAMDDEVREMREGREQGGAVPVGFDDDNWVSPREPV